MSFETSFMHPIGTLSLLFSVGHWVPWNLFQMTSDAAHMFQCNWGLRVNYKAVLSRLPAAKKDVQILEVYLCMYISKKNSSPRRLPPSIRANQGTLRFLCQSSHRFFLSLNIIFLRSSYGTIFIENAIFAWEGHNTLDSLWCFCVHHGEYKSESH